MNAPRPRKPIQNLEPVDVRADLVDALRLDLVGPGKGSELENEVLPQAPSRWSYLTGFLVPLEASEEQRSDETAAEEAAELEGPGATDDAGEPEPASARRTYFPSSMGLSLLAPAAAETLQVTVRWGDYRRQAGGNGETPDDADPGDVTREDRQAAYQWQRTQREERLDLAIPERTDQPLQYDVPAGGGLKAVLSVRPAAGARLEEAGVPLGARAVSLFIVNRRPPVEDDERRDETFAFQVELAVESDHDLVPWPNLRGLDTGDWDERVADLQYRDALSFGVGHGVATRAEIKDGGCRRLFTRWMPAAEVERVAYEPIKGVELGQEALAELADGDDARQKLGAFVSRYREWIDDQESASPTAPQTRAETAAELIRRARIAADRIERGIELLADPEVLDAFRIANRAMARQARQRFGTQRGLDPQTIEAPAWRPFQLAFILMNLRGIVDPVHEDRRVVDLLFFPTGGGKTEAYLGLAAFTLVLRRLRHPGISSAGVSVLMRYTLRLLTLDQLSRAAALVCALELERQADPEKLGEWPFEIGLWVGQAATPNRMGKKGDGGSYSARSKTIAFQNDTRRPSPIPLEECPWCGDKFGRNSFQLLPDTDRPTDLRIRCKNRRCDFTRNRPLPILAVDEPIYRRLPAFLIATIDKFAAMPWTGEVGAFFGRVQRHDADGFYGPCQPGQGRPLPSPLPPPELVIQDELHLISGPLGTMAGLYETALDELSAREVEGHTVRPKVIASTATVRRAESQIRALFNRRAVDIFPPPGADRRDSFFARTHTPEESHARLYLGIAAQGRSLKVVLLRAYLALLGAARKAYLEAGGKDNEKNPADPYMTLVGYFNSLRELGGSRRIVEDEVSTRLTGYSRRARLGESAGLFADRKIAYDVIELTSRVSTDKVAEAKRRLALPFPRRGTNETLREAERVDVALATNMISVGLDITRLGLMVVLGQPKTSSEYIQASSRVGRDPERPGLVVTLLNIHRPRDRSHYERFDDYHASFYRSVEATSVTPFSPRALDRGLAGTLVALARHGHDPMTPPEGAAEILSERPFLDVAVDALAARAAGHEDLPAAAAEARRQRVRDRAAELLDEWSKLAADYGDKGIRLQYQREVGGAQRLLYDFLDPELAQHPRHRKFRANRSLRDVEASVGLWMRTLDEADPESGE